MIPSFSSSENLWPSNNTRRPNRDHLFMNLMFRDERYRLRTKDYLETNCSVNMWMIFWFCAVFTIVGHILQHFLPSRQNLIMFGFGAIAFTGLAIYTIKISGEKICKLSTITLVAYFSGCLIMSIFNSNILLYPTLIYIILETIGSLAFLKNRNHLFGKFIIFTQLLIIVLKNDQRMIANWEQTLFGLLLAFYFCLASLITITSFIIVNILCFKELVSSIKNIGLTYIQMQTLNFLLLTGIPIFQKIYEIKMFIIPSLFLIMAIVNLVFSIRFKESIVMFFCRIQKINSINQIITLIQIEEQKLEKVAFAKKSDNWYYRIPKNTSKQLIIAMENKLQIILGQQKCLVCLEQEPNIIWMPCGHLCICQQCCFQMFDHKTSSCILCKDIPQAIYFVSDEDRQKIEEQSKIEVEVIIQQQQNSNYSNKLNIMYPYKGFSVKIC